MPRMPNYEGATCQLSACQGSSPQTAGAEDERDGLPARAAGEPERAVRPQAQLKPLLLRCPHAVLCEVSEEPIKRSA